MAGQPHVPVLVPGRLARVQAHPHPQRDALGPAVAGKALLRRHATPDRIGSRPEHHEETVTFGAHLMAAEFREGCALKRPLCRERLTVPVAKTAQ